jgi:hypothetical protein
MPVDAFAAGRRGAFSKAPAEVVTKGFFRRGGGQECLSGGLGDYGGVFFALAVILLNLSCQKLLNRNDYGRRSDQGAS